MRRRATQERDFIQSIHSEAASLVTEIPGVASAVAAAIPGAITGAIPDVIEAILPRNGSLGTRQVCAGNMLCPSLSLGIASLIVGLLLILVFTGFSIAFTLGLLPLLAGNVIWKAYTYLISGLLCCTPFLVPIIIVRVLASAAEHLPPWIHWQLGEAYRLCIGALCCAACVVVLSVVVLVRTTRN